MSHQRFRFEKRKSVADFLSENISNQFLYHCLKANTSLPDETILEAFNEAYQKCIDVLASPDTENARSAALPEMGRSAPRSSLLHYCIVYYLLSFHEEAANLRPLLFNLDAMLDAQMHDVFKPLKDSVEHLSPLLHGHVNFHESLASAMLPPAPVNNSDQYVRIPTLMYYAEKLSNHDAKVVLEAVKYAADYDKGDWAKILEMDLTRISLRPEPGVILSPYTIVKKQLTNFIKLLSMIYELNIFKTIDGSKMPSSENFVIEVSSYFNADASNVRSLLSSAKRTENFMDVFDELRDHAEAYYYKGLADSQPSKPSTKKSPSSMELDL